MASRADLSRDSSSRTHTGQGNSDRHFDDSRQVELIQRGVALFGLLLIAVTWRLWTPQNLFPRVPVLESLARLPEPAATLATWCAVAVCCASLTAIVLLAHHRTTSRIAAGLVAISFIALVLLDQHRLQPWIVHISVCLLIAALAQPERRWSYLVWFTASIYIYSALGKFDAQFLHTVGQDFVHTALRGLGWDADRVDERLRLSAAAALPLFELCVGLGLLFRPARTISAIGAIFMHVLLLGLLGPWGLGHAWGVLFWNALFILVSALLFLWPWKTKISPPRDTLRIGPIEVLLAMCLIAPLGERFGLVDHWLGWALYAPHSSRAQVEISSQAVESLPAVVQPFVDCQSDPPGLWCSVRIDRWSLATLGAPVTPQQRFQIGVARALSQYVDDFEIRVDALDTANRWSGRRGHREFRGSIELAAAAERYWLNTTPCFAPKVD